VSYIKNARVLVAMVVFAGVVTLLPAAAEAQQRRVVVRHRPISRQVVFVHAPVVPYSWPYGYWRPYGHPWGQYGPYGWRYGYRDELITTVRLQVTPREAEVYVDGYAAGQVDDFDGVFQRLRLRPGGHEIVVYLDGHRAFHQTLYLNPGSNHTIRHTMELLPAGEPAEARPVPSTAAAGDGDLAVPPAPFDPRPAPAPPPERAEPRGRFGTLALHVQPADAEILIDDQPWSAAAEGSRIAIQLGAGRHRVEVRKAGFAAYREDVLIRPNATLSLNVSLTGR